MSAALVVARAPGAADVLPGLAELLDDERRAALQAVLIRRAAAWAAAAGAAYVAVSPAAEAGAVAALLPDGTRVFGADSAAAAVAHVGRGPLLIAGTDCPQLGPGHAAAALEDLAEGCDVTFGSTLEGGWYLAGLREPRPELLALADLRSGGIATVLERAREADAAVGLLRHERVLATPGDVAALLADPLLAADVRAAIGG